MYRKCKLFQMYLIKNEYHIIAKPHKSDFRTMSSTTSVGYEKLATFLSYYRYFTKDKCHDVTEMNPQSYILWGSFHYLLI